MKQALKTAAAIAGMIAAAWVAFELLRAFMWVCYDAGIPM